MEISAGVREQVLTEAVEWFLRFENAADATDRQAFAEWLTRSPLHIEEYLAVSSAWGGLGLASAERFETEALIAAARTEPAPDNVVPWPPRAPHAAPQRGSPHAPRPGRWVWGRWTWGRAWGSVAASLLLATAAALFALRQSHVTDYSTAIGEQRSVILSDGSTVYLDTNSEVQARWSVTVRHMDLLRGQAQFHVAKNPSRPFIVATAEATVRAVGTVFNVRADLSRTQVAVIEGRVEVRTVDHAGSRAASGKSAPTRPAAVSPAYAALPVNVQLRAGERAAVTKAGIEPNAGLPMASITGWTERRLIFRGEALADVVNEFNRYRSNRRMVLEDAALANLKINAVFDLNDPESLIDYLKTFETVHVGEGGDGNLHLSRVPPAPAAQK